MKTYKVDSKYKNPDKFIDSLKYEVQRRINLCNGTKDRCIQLQKDNDKFQKEINLLSSESGSEEWFDVTHDMSISLSNPYSIEILKKIDLGHKVFCSGEIIEKHRKDSANSVGITISKVRIAK